MHTPYFPTFRSRLAALGRRTAHLLRQATLAQLEDHLRDFLPAPLLSAEDQGPNSRDRIFSLRLTFECFLWQLLKPKTSCREVVRQVQALFRLHGRGHVDEGDSAYIQARLRLPKERLEKALTVTAQAADRRAGQGGQLNGRPVKVVDASTPQLADTRRLRYAEEQFYLRSAEEMKARFAEVPEAARNTLEIAEKCNLEIEFGRLHYPVFQPPEHFTREGYLRHLLVEGLRKRYGIHARAEGHDFVIERI